MDNANKARKTDRTDGLNKRKDIENTEDIRKIENVQKPGEIKKIENIPKPEDPGKSEELKGTISREGNAETTLKREQSEHGISTPHDRGYKKSLSRPSEFLHFLKKYVKADWMMELKESDISLCDKEMLERDYEGKEADLLYRVNMSGGREVFIFILQELQSYVDYTMIFRILVYVVNTLMKYFLDRDKNERERQGFRLPAMVPIVFYNGQDRWTAVRSLKEYQKSGSIFGNYILNLEYYLVDLSEIGEDYILSTNTVVDNIMYCDKYRKKLELVGAIRTAYSRIGELGLQEREEFRNWVKYILLSVCGNKEAVVEEILSWAGTGEDDMAFKYNIIRAFEDEREEGRKEGHEEGRKEGLEEGLEEGMIQKLVSQVRKKSSKNIPVLEIADMLEEDETVIRQIYDRLQEHPDWDDKQICDELAVLRSCSVVEATAE